MITHCLEPNAGQYSPSDFPDENLNEKELEDLLSQLGETS